MSRSSIYHAWSKYTGKAPLCVYACMHVCVCVCCMSSGNRLETAAHIRYRFLFRAQTDTVHNPHCETNSPEPLPGSHLTLSHTHTHTSKCMRHTTDHTSWLQAVHSKTSQSNNKHNSQRMTIHSLLYRCKDMVTKRERSLRLKWRRN